MTAAQEHESDDGGLLCADKGGPVECPSLSLLVYKNYNSSL